jgi:hypothetical protein
MVDSLIDCEVGRRLGCRTFCCRLLVRLDEDEREPAANGAIAKGFVDKGPDGLCVHLDRSTHRCGIWEKRPRICREYDCNHDYLLQAAIRLGVTNIVQLSRDAQSLRIATDGCIKIPGCGEEFD